VRAGGPQHNGDLERVSKKRRKNLSDFNQEVKGGCKKDKRKERDTQGERHPSKSKKTKEVIKKKGRGYTGGFFKGDGIGGKRKGSASENE